MTRRLAPVTIARRLRDRVSGLEFAPPVTHVYNPLEYAWASHRAYLERFAAGPKEAVFVGMNPGPWGMAQTGVPFGDVARVRDWIGVSGKVNKPANEHPKREILGFDCTRSEVSGTRIWQWAEARFRQPEHFFDRFFVWNYCPLSFMEETGRNRTPDKLRPDERKGLFSICDESLAQLLATLQPTYVVGIGRFATDRIAKNPGLDPGIVVGMAPHPSPASPAANRGWAPIFESALAELGITL